MDENRQWSFSRLMPARVRSLAASESPSFERRRGHDARRKDALRELEIDAALVARLIAAQFPQWADLPITWCRVSRCKCRCRSAAPLDRISRCRGRFMTWLDWAHKDLNIAVRTTPVFEASFRIQFWKPEALGRASTVGNARSQSLRPGDPCARSSRGQCLHRELDIAWASPESTGFVGVSAKIR
jgi:hypothetical protein